MTFGTKRKSSNMSDDTSKFTGQKGVPAFLNKLYNMIDDESTNILIRWSRDGKSFLVEKHEEFAKTVLPRFYKHNTFASFVRQLNMYDFHKIPHIQTGVMINESEHQIWEFSHPHFQKQRSDLLTLVTRKKNKESDSEPNLTHLVDDLSMLKENQTQFQSELLDIKRDNEVLWQETLNSREKHQSHQKALEKILMFLTTVFPSDQLNSGALIKEAALSAGVSIDQNKINQLGSTHQASSSVSQPQSDRTNETPTITNFTHTIDTVTHSALSINQEIDRLQVNIESLANNLGIDPSQYDIKMEQHMNNKPMPNLIYPYSQQKRPSQMKAQEREPLYQYSNNNNRQQYENNMRYQPFISNSSLQNMTQENYGFLDLQNNPDMPSPFYNKR
ncbi:stress-responsive transcription factor hsf1 [Rhizopus stolonifer]|uniref:Stress-responsive transcription factor hsf1 n=1 Tax=Rhizopus stolonifer TaxID=4846 RepID=A0A367KP36_RHIST|nr:stress-responsive transcription factor hsf1 [Rhizopus stolonifer]